jgi:hypothetical protein
MREQILLRESPRTKINLENYLRMAFLPNGLGEFMQGVNYELNLGPRQSQMNLAIATATDIAKYVYIFNLAFYLFK